MRIGETVDQTLGLATGQQLVGVLTDDLAEMRGKSGNVVYDGVSGGERLRLRLARYPLSGHIERRLASFLSRQSSGREFGTDGEKRIATHLPTRDLDTAQRNNIFVLAQ